MAVTKLDVLSGISPLRVCVGYRCGDKTLDTVPPDISTFGRCRPIYEEIEGWRSDVDWGRAVKEGYEALPEQVKEYLQLIEEQLRVPISIVSVGPERNETIVLDEALLS
ncbi:MAG: Adenylosuccinate synthetase [Candidatus Bathyarchaeota archaeon B63]|nr:MAG: Adenylosuccinate synthetase [Candidatus Bathyarchaeota archaeon B63]